MHQPTRNELLIHEFRAKHKKLENKTELVNKFQATEFNHGQKKEGVRNGSHWIPRKIAPAALELVRQTSI